MITRFATLSSRMALAFTLLFMVAACGGGGSGGSFLPEDGGGTNYRIALTLTDSFGEPTDTVTSAAPIVLTALVTRKSNGQAVEGVVVTTGVDIGTILPETGTALTNSDGVASFQIAAGDTLGAGTAVSTVENPDDEAETPFTASISFRVGQTDLRLGHFEDSSFINGAIGISVDELAVGGSAILEFAVVDENDDPAATAQVINLSSGCTTAGLATMPTEVETVNGRAQAIYTANGCSGADDITALLATTGAAATGTITVAPLEADVITFASVIPATGSIALEGTGSINRPEAATVSFLVTAGDVTGGSGGTPLPGIDVEFALSTDVGGLSLSDTSGTTDANGIVKTTVQSGYVATSVVVAATIQTDGDDGPSTISSSIVISSGLPTQNSISLQVEQGQAVNIQGALEFNGRTTLLEVSLSDEFNNPVPDGTSAVFTTEYGTIDASCETVNGVCSVTWTSNAPRFPVSNQDLIQTTSVDNTSYNCMSHAGDYGPCPDDLGAIRGLRSNVLVTVKGNEYFLDANGNGLYDEGEQFENLPEPFLDKNEDGVYTPIVGPMCPSPPSSAANCTAAGAEETFVDTNNDGEYSLNDNPAVYNGSSCPPEGDGNWCSRTLVDISATTVLVMSADAGEDFTVLMVDERNNRPVQKTVSNLTYRVYVADLYNNRPAEGVPVTVVNDTCSTTVNTLNAPNSNEHGSYAARLNATAPGDVNDPNTWGAGGNFTVDVGGVSRAVFACVHSSGP